MPIQRDPSGTTTTAGWTPTGAATLSDALADASDSSFISCTDGSACVVSLTAFDHPNENAGSSATVRVVKTVDTSQTCDLLVELLEGGSTVRATWTISNVEDVLTDHVLDIAEADFATIVDPTQLSLRITDLASPLTAQNNVARAFLTVADRRLHAHATG